MMMFRQRRQANGTGASTIALGGNLQPPADHDQHLAAAQRAAATARATAARIRASQSAAAGERAAGLSVSQAADRSPVTFRPLRGATSPRPYRTEYGPFPDTVRAARRQPGGASIDPETLPALGDDPSEMKRRFASILAELEGLLRSARAVDAPAT